MPDPLPSRYDLMLAAMRGEPLPSEDPATPFSMLRRPPRAPEVELPKDEFPGWFAKLMAGVEGATGIPIGPNPEHYQKGGEDLAGYSDLGELGSMLLGPLAAGMAMTRQGVKQGIRAGARRIANPIRAHHGSPHDFEQFDFSKIGTGEGNQAYGYGGYFAENPSVSGRYRMLAPRTATPTPEVRDALRQLDDLGFDTPGQALGAIEGDPKWMTTWDVDPTRSPEEGRALTTITDWLEKNPRGHGYEVNIHATPEELLDWDKPLSEQSPLVQKTLRDAGVTDPTLSGAEAYHRLGGSEGLEGATRRLQEVSLESSPVKGIQYLDQGSRAAGQGTRNFVIFDDQLIEIAKKYGVPLAVAGEWVRQQGGTVQSRGADQ